MSDRGTTKERGGKGKRCREARKGEVREREKGGGEGGRGKVRERDKREGRSERGSEGSRDGERARCGAAPRDSAAWRKMPHAHIGAGSERAAGEGNGSWRTCVCAVICMGI